jgi:hypothetical protein
MPKTVTIDAERWERVRNAVGADPELVYLILEPDDLDPIDPDPEPSKPFDLLAAVLAEQGHDPQELTKRDLGRQLAVAKRLIADGVTTDEAREMTRWLPSINITGIDLFTIERFVTRYRLKADKENAATRPQRDDWRMPGQLVTV